MVYFSNGSEGSVLDQQCDECIHSDPDAACPIALIQLEYNYDQLKEGNADLKKVMSILIGDNGKCNMKPFISSPKVLNPRKKCFQRPLKFGDEEQIDALNGGQHA